MSDVNPQTIYLKDYTVPDFLIRSVDLSFKLAEENTRVLSRLTLRRNSDSQTGDVPLILAGENLTLISVVLNDDNELTEKHYLQTSDSLVIHDVPQHREFVLTIREVLVNFIRDDPDAARQQFTSLLHHFIEGLRLQFAVNMHHIQSTYGPAEKRHKQQLALKHIGQIAGHDHRH